MEPVEVGDGLETVVFPTTDRDVQTDYCHQI
jgi:hypothetical protein